MTCVAKPPGRTERLVNGWELLCRASSFGLCLERIFGLLATGPISQFLYVGVVFRGAWPWGRILRKTASPVGYVIPHARTGTG